MWWRKESANRWHEAAESKKKKRKKRFFIFSPLNYFRFSIMNESINSHPSIKWSGATRQTTPRSIKHLPLTGSTGDKLMYGGSSKNVIFKWNFSGTPCGGACEFPGQTISRMSSFCVAQDFQTPILWFYNNYNTRAQRKKEIENHTKHKTKLINEGT